MFRRAPGCKVLLLTPALHTGVSLASGASSSSDRSAPRCTFLPPAFAISQTMLLMPSPFCECRSYLLFKVLGNFPCSSEAHLPLSFPPPLYFATTTSLGFLPDMILQVFANVRLETLWASVKLSFTQPAIQGYKFPFGALGAILATLTRKTELSGICCMGQLVRTSPPVVEGFPDCSVGKESACNTGDPGSIPGSGKSTGEGKGYPLQYSGLENSMDCIVHGVAKSQIQLSYFHFHLWLGTSTN